MRPEAPTASSLADPVLLASERRRREKAQAAGAPDVAPPRFPKVRGPHAPTLGSDIAPTAKATPPPKKEANDWQAEDDLGAQLEAAEREPLFRDALLPDGAVIEAAFMRVTEATIAGGARKFLALFKILRVLEPRGVELGDGLVILRSWNPPAGRCLSRRHALFADWQAVVGRPLRTLPKRYSAQALLGLFLRDVTVKARTRVVSTYHDPRTKTTVEQAPYSVIDRLLGRTVGTPRVLQRRTPAGEDKK